MTLSDIGSIARTLVGESAVVPGLSPWECLERAGTQTPGQALFLWEAPQGEAFAGIGTACRVEAEGPERFAEIQRRLLQLFKGAEHRGTSPAGFPGAIAIGGFAFADQGALRGWPGFADASFYVPSRTYWSAPGAVTIETRWSADGELGNPADAGAERVGAAPAAGAERAAVAAARPERAAGDESAAPEVPDAASKARWLDAVRRTLERIREGDFSKAVLARSRSIQLDRSSDPIAIMGSLRAAYPNCYRFLISDGRGGAFLGASPERLVRLARGEVLTEAVAGTLRCEPGDDGVALARTLAESKKDQSEHRIVLQYLIETLTPVCESLQAPDAPEVMRLPHLLHLRTPVRGVARPGAHVLDLVSRLHPTPAVAGWPRSEALSWIGRVETAGRGWFAGPVGWVGAQGDGDFAVGIRSIAIHGRRARLFAGAGIVEGSDPELEWNETELKMKGILDAVARD